MKMLVDALNIINQPTGAGIFSYHMLKEMSQRSDIEQISVLVRSDLAHSHQIFSLPLSFIRQDIPTIGIKREFALPLLLFRLRHKFDLFFSFMPYLSLLPPSLPSFITVHDLAYVRYPELAKSSLHVFYFKWLLRRSILSAKHIFTVSYSTRRDLQKFFSVTDKQITVTYPDSSFGNAIQNKNIFDKQNYFLFVGERRKHKNIEQMLKAFTLFKKQDAKHFKFILIGKDYDLEYTSFLKNMIKSLNIDDSVELLESVSSEVLINYFQNAFALLFVSTYEGFGIPLLEAMRCGIPIITSNVYSMPEVTDGSALYVDPNSEEDIYMSMRKLVNDKKLRDDLIKKGQRRAAFFSWKKSADQLVDTLKQYATHT